MGQQDHDLWMEQLGTDWMGHSLLEDSLEEIEKIASEISELEKQKELDALTKLSKVSNAFQRRSAAFEKLGRAVYQLLEE